MYFQKKNAAAIAYGEREDRLYKMHIRVFKESKLQVATSSLRVWYERLDHVNFETLREMSAKEIVKDLYNENTAKVVFMENSITLVSLNPVRNVHRRLVKFFMLTFMVR